jgi:hypothetical protein
VLCTIQKPLPGQCNTAVVITSLHGRRGVRGSSGPLALSLSRTVNWGKPVGAIWSCSSARVPGTSHRSQSLFDAAVVGFDAVVRVLLNVVPGRRDQLVKHPRVDPCGAAWYRLALDDVP